MLPTNQLCSSEGLVISIMGYPPLASGKVVRASTGQAGSHWGTGGSGNGAEASVSAATPPAAYGFQANELTSLRDGFSIFHPALSEQEASVS